MASPVPAESELISGRVRIVLEDGTLASPTLDPEQEDRLRYLLDNLTTPTDPPPA